MSHSHRPPMALRPHLARFYKSRRCRFFEDNGDPRVHPGGPGCREGSSCNYAHPDDPQWAHANPPTELPPPSRPPVAPHMFPSARAPSPYGPPPPPGLPRGAPRERVPSTSSTHDRDRDRDIEMSAPRGPRAHSPTKSTASSSTRRPSYVASGARLRDEEEGERGRYRDDDDRRRGDEKRYEDRSRDRERRRDEDRYRDDEYRREGRRREDRSRDRRSRSSSRHRRPSSSSHHRRRSSSRERDHAKPPPKELTMEERRKLWLDRIQLLSQSIQVCKERVRLHEDRQKYERLVKSAQHDNLPEEEKAALQDLIASTSTHFQKKQTELNRLTGQLIPDDFWPFVQREQHAAYPIYQEISRKLVDAQEDVHRLLNALTSAQASHPPAVAPATTSTSAAAPASASAPAPAAKPEPGEIPVDAPQAARPKKRRRLSTDAEIEVPEFLAEDAERIKDRLASLAHTVSELQNDLLQYDSRVADEVDAHLDYKMAGLRLGVGGEGDKPVDPKLQERVQELADSNGSVKEQVTQAETSLAELQVEVQRLDEEHERLQTQREELRKVLEETRAQHQTMSEALATQSKQNDAQSEAIKALAARVSNPPLPPPPLTADAILEGIRPKLLDAIREDLAPVLMEVHAHIQKELQEQSTMVSGELMKKINPVVTEFESISAFIDRVRRPNTTTVTTSTPVGSASTDKGKGVAR